MTNSMPSKTLTVVFFDICSYSRMARDEQLLAVEVAELAIKGSVNQQRQIPIVEGGDSFALGFDNTAEALEFAVEVAKHFQQNPPFKIRTGVYTGEVVIRETINGVKNIYGRGIDFASRLASCCGPGQILVSKNTYDECSYVDNRYKQFRHSLGQYSVKHGIHIEVYNVWSDDESFGVADLPLKRKLDDSSFILIVGDRRERPAQTVGDLFHAAPSIDDLCHILKFDWPQDILLRGDKLLCWTRGGEGKDVLDARNLLVLGSPKVNIAAFMMNRSSIFNFRLDQTSSQSIDDLQRRFAGAQRNDKTFLEYCEQHAEKIQVLRSHLNLLSIEDPFEPSCFYARTGSQSYALISFAAHPTSENPRRFAVFIAGIDLCATLAVTAKFCEIDFSQRTLGGVVEVQRTNKTGRPWFEAPHYGELKEGAYWKTRPYTIAELRQSLEGPRRDLVDRLSDPALGMSIPRIQTLFRRP